jgi:hypothetical protein
VCVYVCVYVCMYVRMYVCMYVCIFKIYLFCMLHYYGVVLHAVVFPYAISVHFHIINKVTYSRYTLVNLSAMILLLSIIYQKIYCS